MIEAGEDRQQPTESSSEKLLGVKRPRSESDEVSSSSEFPLRPRMNSQEISDSQESSSSSSSDNDDLGSDEDEIIVTTVS